MSHEAIEKRINELMGMQKVELARLVAEHEADQAPAMEQGVDPVIIEVLAPSAAAEVLEPTDAPAPEPAATVEGADAAPIPARRKPAAKKGVKK